MRESVLGMDEAMRLLRKEVANKGADYVYERVGDFGENPIDGQGRVYVHKGAPSCVVGHVLVDFGVSADVLTQHNDSRAMYLRNYDVPISANASLVLYEAQRVQDQGETWGAALAAAETKYRVLGGTE